jgi:predicted phage-related endonuclease
MSGIEMSSKVQELRELRRMADELQAEIDSLTDVIKGEMNARNIDTLSGADWKVTWKEVTSSRLDTAALKKALPDVAAAFTKSSVSRRFIVA